MCRRRWWRGCAGRRRGGRERAAAEGVEIAREITEALQGEVAGIQVAAEREAAVALLGSGP